MSRISCLITIFTTFMALLFGAETATGQTSVKLPDFAYPKTVEAGARKALERADADNGPARLRALLELFAAQRTIDINSTFLQPATIRQQLAIPGLSNASKAMLLSLEADIISNIYTRQAFKYNRVDAPAEPYPDDISEWSGEQFRTRAMALLDSAALLADATPLSVFDTSVEYSPEALKYLPTVADFIRYRQLRTSEAFARYNYPDYTALQKQICDEGIKASKAASAPFFFWSVERALRISDSRQSYDKINELYSAYDSVEAARYALAALCDRVSMPTYYNEEQDGNYEFRRNEAFAKELKTSLSTFPKWYDNAVLSNKLADITRAYASAEVDGMVAPGTDFDIRVKYRYAKSVRIDVYKVSSGSRISAAALAGRSPAASLTITPDSDFGSTTSSMTLNVPGTYAMKVSVDGKSDNSDVSKFQVSPMLGIAVNGCTRASALALDFTTGAPLKDVDVIANSYYPQKTTKALGKTDSKGMLTVSAENIDKNRTLSFRYKGAEYTFNNAVRLNPFNVISNDSVYNIVVLSDRTLYHPGESIQWAIVGGGKTSLAPHGEVLAEKRMTVKLFDSNGEMADSCEVVTDMLGRAHGTFATRKGLLTGDYRIQVSYLNDNAYRYITVSDFKAPVFEVVIDSVGRDTPAKGAVTMTGSARTYSGMPVADASVAVRINGTYRWRWFSPAAELGTVDSRTDSEGRFRIVIPADMLERELDYGSAFTDFVASVDVTSSAAETASARQAFTTGKPYSLSANLTSQYVNTDKPFDLLVSAYDGKGEKGTIAYMWHITDKDKSKGLPSGVARTGEKVSIDLSGLAAGEYQISIEAADTTLANSFVSPEMEFYSIRHNDVPARIEGFFLPSETADIDGHSAKVTVGTNAGKLYLYTFVRSRSELRMESLSRLGRGFSTVRVDIPESLDDTEICLVAVLEGKVYRRYVTIKKPVEKETEFRAESFRDHLVPGASETWRLRLCKGKEGLAGAGVIATMYNKALDALQPGQWATGFSFYTPSYRLDVNYPYSSRSTSFYNEPIRFVDAYNMQWPQYMFASQAAWNHTGMMLKSMARGAKVEQANGLAETTDFAASNALYEEKAVSADYAAEGNEAGATEPEFTDYREAEILQAFWQPSLVADADGNIDIVFTVPDANATWQFKAFGWTRQLNTAAYMATALANRPVMVQPNLPRFLRQGDKATVLATVYNNSDDSRVVTSTVEIFELEGGKITATFSQTDTIGAMSSCTIAADIVAPVDAAAIGYRVRSTTGEYTDGEQAAIPVLSSAATVIESTDFYLNPGANKPFELTVKTPADATLTLQYCQNPIWTIVKAMRGVASGECLTATGTVSHLFSALAAKHIVESNPDIAEAIKTWSDNPSEEALTSMLERNGDLKRLMLDQTPWVQTAKSNSARMAALAQLLAPASAEKAIADCLDRLSKMQNSDGGFRWGSWSSGSSVWATETVMTTLGIARSLGVSVDMADDILRRAFTYIQNEAVKTNQPATDRNLTFIASQFPQYSVSVKADKIIRNTVAGIAANWKKDGTTGKAYDIIILKANGRAAEAARILESVRQHAVVKEGTGMSFPNVADMRSYATILQAYALMDAPKAEIDAMRQWVTVQAQALDNLVASNPDYIIAAMLLTGSDWTSVPVSQSVTVDGKPLAIDNAESSTGYFAQEITTSGRKTYITIRPNGVTPSYGSVISISRQPSTAVKARPGKDLSIEKRCLVEREGSWVETDRFNLGERVRVQLTVKAARNLEYVSVDDERPASFAPVDQLPGFVWDGALGFYRENLDASTRLFIGYLPQGTYHISYDMTASLSGRFTSGIATLQSQYAPELTAHSAGTTIQIETSGK